MPSTPRRRSSASKAVFDLTSSSPESATGRDRTFLQLQLERARSRCVRFKAGGSPELLTPWDHHPELSDRDDDGLEDAGVPEGGERMATPPSSSSGQQDRQESEEDWLDEEDTLVASPSNLSPIGPPAPPQTTPVSGPPARPGLSFEKIEVKRTFSSSQLPSGSENDVSDLATSSLPGPISLYTASSPPVAMKPSPLSKIISSMPKQLVIKSLPNVVEAPCGLSKPVAWNESALNRGFEEMKRRELLDPSPILAKPPISFPAMDPMPTQPERHASYAEVSKKNREPVVSEFCPRPNLGRRTSSSTSLPMSRTTPMLPKSRLAFSASPVSIAHAELHQLTAIIPSRPTSIRRQECTTAVDSSPETDWSLPLSKGSGSSTCSDARSPSTASSPGSSPPPSTSSGSTLSKASTSSRSPLSGILGAPFSPAGKSPPSTAVCNRSDSSYLDRLFVPPTLALPPHPLAQRSFFDSAPDVLLPPSSMMVGGSSSTLSGPMLFETYQYGSDPRRAPMSLPVPYVTPSSTRVVLPAKKVRSSSLGAMALSDKAGFLLAPGVGELAKQRRRKRSPDFERTLDQSSHFEPSVFSSAQSNSAAFLQSYASGSSSSSSTSMFRTRTLSPSSLFTSASSSSSSDDPPVSPVGLQRSLSVPSVVVPSFTSHTQFDQIAERERKEQLANETFRQEQEERRRRVEGQGTADEIASSPADVSSAIIQAAIKKRLGRRTKAAKAAQ